MAKFRFGQNSEPKVSKFALKKERRNTKYFRFVGVIREIDMDDVMFSPNDPRADGVDPLHVADIQVNLETAGFDEDGELSSFMRHPEYPGKWIVIDQHHLISSLKNMKQKKWIGNEYEYTGSYGENHMWAAATELGFGINNDHNPTKKTTMSSVECAALKKIETLGYIHEPGTPVDVDHIKLWMDTCDHSKVFAKGKITQMINNILNPTAQTGKKIRPLTLESISAMFAQTSGLYGTAELTNNRYGFLVKTDNYAADGPKGYNQMVTQLEKGKTPVFITYSGKDDATKIVENNRHYFEKMYDTYKKHMLSVETFHGISFPLITYEEFLTKIEIVAIGQIDGEYDQTNFIERPLN